MLQDQAFGRSFFPQLPTDEQDRTERSYTLKLGGTERIAGQTVRNLEVLPNDDYRYGFSLMQALCTPFPPSAKMSMESDPYYRNHKDLASG